MKLPTGFKMAVRKRGEMEKKQKAKDTIERKKETELISDYKLKEKSKETVKIVICKEIFAWRNDFLRTAEGAKVFKKQDRCLLITILNWGHCLHDKNDHAAWSRIYFDEGGILYRAGWKWMPTGPNLLFTKPEEMAKMIDYNYLKNFLLKIKSGKIYKDILNLNR